MKASICISSFNKPLLLQNTLKSIFAQKVPFDYEVIVIDDGSENAKVSEICKAFPVVCQRIEREPSFRNPCTARNAAYKLAQGDVVIAQSDEVMHITPNAIEQLAVELESNPRSFIIANVFNVDRNGHVFMEYTGKRRRKPFFFLGALWRKDIYAIGGNDEDFAIGLGYEDAWFGDCLIHGLGLSPVYVTSIRGHHQKHAYNSSVALERETSQIYAQKVEAAQKGIGKWTARAGSWLYLSQEEMNSMPDMEKVFSMVQKTLQWQGSESISGTGSSLEATKVIQQEVPKLLSNYGITSMLDLPCGDFNWMRNVQLNGTSYIGGDVVRSIVHQNKQKYPNIDFRYLDILTSDLPKVDCILCRDCLQHFSFGDVKKAIINIKRAGIKYILATTFPSHPNNKDIPTGSWTPHSLEHSPFNAPTPIAVINEDCKEVYPQFNDKSLALWEVDSLGGIAHHMRFFWIGKLSWMRYLTLATFRKWNPDWKITLHTQREMGKVNWKTMEMDDRAYIGLDYTDKVGDLGIQVEEYETPFTHLAPAQLSDVFQWDVLYNKGGYYADMDILWLKSMFEMEKDILEPVSTIFCMEADWLAIGFFGAIPRLDLYHTLYQTALSNVGNLNKYQQLGVNVIHDNYLLKDEREKYPYHKWGRLCINRIREKYPAIKLHLVPDQTIYPFFWNKISQIFESDAPVHPKAVGIHWFGGSPEAQKWNLLLTEDNWDKYTNTFTNCLKGLLSGKNNPVISASAISSVAST